jgi:hypothetical protein
MAQSETKPTRVTWRMRIRASWQKMSPAERIAWIAAVALIIFGLEIGGFFIAMTDGKGTAYIVNRFTGTVSFCVPSGCRDL